MDKYYLIRIEDQQPDKHNFEPNPVMLVQTEPGRMNMSGKPSTDGWLGTTNNQSYFAFGEFDCLEDALDAADREGFTEEYYESIYLQDPSVVAVIITKEDSLQQAYAYDWFSFVDAEELGITADTTDRELQQIIKDLEEEAYEEGFILTHTEEFVYEVRDSLTKTASFVLEEDIRIGRIVIPAGSIIKAEEFKKRDLGKEIKDVKDKHDKVQETFLQELPAQEVLPSEPFENTWEYLDQAEGYLQYVQEDFESFLKSQKK